MKISNVKSPLLQSNMYLIIEKGHGLVIDPYWSKEVAELINREIDTLDMIFLTHEHYDHISGANGMRAFYNCPIWASVKCARRTLNIKDNFSRYFNAYAIMQSEVDSNVIPKVEPYVCRVDNVFDGGTEIIWQEHVLQLKELPGHSPGSSCIYIDKKVLFIGDTLIEDRIPVTRFPGGNQKLFSEVTLPWLLRLPIDTKVYPGHYEPFDLGSHDIIKQWRKEK